MESRNYIKSFFKSFNVIHLIVLAISVMGMYFLSVNVGGLISTINDPTKLQYTLKGVYLIVLVGVALCYLITIKNKEINLFDLLGLSNLLGILGSLVYARATDNADTYCIILSVIGLVYLVGLVLKVVLNKADIKANHFKEYMHNINIKINPLIFTIIGSIAGLAIAFYFKFDGNIYSKIEPYFYAIMVGIVLLGALLMISSSTKITIIDYILIMCLVISSILTIYGLPEGENNYPLLHSFYLMLVSTFVIYFRGLGYNGDISLKSKIKDNNYHSSVVSKYDYILPVFYGVFAIIMLAMPNIAPGAFNYIINKITGKSFDVINHKLVFRIIGNVLVVLPVILTFAVRGFKNKNISLIDYILKTLEVITVLGIPLTYKVATNFKAYGLPVGLIILIQIFTIVLYIIRIKHFEIEDEVAIEEAVEPDTTLEEESEALVNDSEEVQEENVSDVEEQAEAQEDEPEVEENLDEALVETPEEAKEEEIIESSSIEPEEENPIQDSDSLDDEEDDDDLEEIEEDDKEENTPASLVVSEQRIRLTFEEKTTLASDEVKKYYNEVKNYLLMYRAHARLSKKCESFRYKGLLAKVAFAGKTLKVNLAIDPKTLEGTKYYFKDRSDKKQYQLVPTQIKIKSERGLKYFKELVDMMMQGRDVRPKRRFEATDFTTDLIPDGHAVLYTLGVTKDHLVDTMDVANVPNDLPIDLVYHVPTMPGDAIDGMKEENSIYLDTLCKHFNDGDVITLDILKKNNVLTRGNMLRIKARGTLDKHFIIYADSFEANALAMLLCTGSKVVKLVRNKNN